MSNSVCLIAGAAQRTISLRFSFARFLYTLSAISLRPSSDCVNEFSQLWR